MGNQRVRRCFPHRYGFTQIEIVMSTIFVGLMIAGAMNCFGIVNQGKVQSYDRLAAQGLAQELLNEIISAEYSEPGGETPVFGAEASELTRANFDDVDDYHGWSASPPQDQLGNDLPFANWQRSVSVRWVTMADPSATSATESGLKQIEVTVSKSGQTLCQMQALRCSEY